MPYTRNEPSPVEIIDPVTKLPLGAGDFGGGGGGGAGTSDTTEATQLLVRAAVEAIAAEVSKEITLNALKTVNDAMLAEFQAEVDAMPPHAHVTDVTKFPDRVPFEIGGADTDDILAAVATKRHHVYKGWFQVSGDVTIQFLSDANVITSSLDLLAGDQVVIDEDDFPELYTGVGEALRMSKSAAVTVRGTFFKRTV